ncbi:MAG: bifunctional demethylmenaquinone methyltransferase/2-methoxy-6-polyprenyl-1,4-benzoquinol methylase UbiE [Kiritimatiellia bacterium]
MKKAKVEEITPYTSSERKSVQIEQAFDQIAPHYDFMNRLLSIGIDISWRRRALNSLAAMSPERVLDVATGTGDLAIRLAGKFPGAAITAIDLSQKMLQDAQAKARKKKVMRRIEFLQADALAMPFPDATFELATIGFGLRNFEDINAGCCEMQRVLKPGGTLLVIELSRPQAKIIASGYNFYLSHVIPLLGRAFAGCETEYTYLTASIKEVPQGEAMLAILSRAGFINCSVTRYARGLCSCYTATAR